MPSSTSGRTGRRERGAVVPAVSVEHLSKSYGDSVAVRDVSFEVQKGEVFADAAGPIVSLVFFILVALSGLYFPVKAGSGLATFTGFFPIRHLILGLVDTFNGIPGTSPWNDLLVIATWGVVGAFVSLRRWDWSPKRG